MRTLILKISALKWVESLVRKSFFFKPLVHRFIAGDTLEEAIEHSKVLTDQGLFVTLDYLGENATTEAEALSAVEAYEKIIHEIGKYPEQMNISIKLTQCGLDQGTEFAEKNFRHVLEVAKAKGVFVRVDMEASDYTERTVAMIERVFPDYENTGTVLQSYLKRSMDDVRRMIQLGARVRVVKGAYLEPESIAYPEKARVDEKYLEMAFALLKEGHYPAIATHDQKIVDAVLKFVKEHQIDPAKFEFQMLYGIRRDLQASLRADGFKVRVYVPFGDQWYPYFSRRLAERPENLWFIVRSLAKK